VARAVRAWRLWAGHISDERGLRVAVLAGLVPGCDIGVSYRASPLIGARLLTRRAETSALCSTRFRPEPAPHAAARPT
jgi:hypothetical protein